MRHLVKSLGWILLASSLFLATSVSAQTPITVSATITDPNGLPYSNANVQAQLIPTGGTPTIVVGGIPRQIGGQQNANTDVNGSFTMNLFCNQAGNGCSVITAGGLNNTQWQLTVQETGVQPPIGTGPQTFSVTITLSGAGGLSQNLSATLNAAALALSHITGGGSSAFSALTSGTNTTATMLVGTGASLGTTGSGTIAATSCGTAPSTQILFGSTCTGNANLIFDTTGNRHFAANAALATMGQSSANAAVQLFAGTPGLNFVNVNGEGSSDDVEIGAGNTANSRMLFSTSSAFGFTSSQVTGSSGFNFISTNPGVLFGLASPLATAILNQNSPPLALGANSWNGLSPQADGYTLTVIPDATPIARLQIVHGGNGFYCGPGPCPGGTILDIGKATEGGSIRVNADTSGSATLGVAAVAGTPNRLNLPTTTGAVNQVLGTDGGNPQQLSWQNRGGTPGTFAGAGTCNAGAEGQIAAMTDSNTNVWGASIAGGGANHVLGYCDGTNWTVAAK